MAPPPPLSDRSHLQLSQQSAPSLQERQDLLEAFEIGRPPIVGRNGQEMVFSFTFFGVYVCVCVLSERSNNSMIKSHLTWSPYSQGMHRIHTAGLHEIRTPLDHCIKTVLNCIKN